MKSTTKPIKLDASKLVGFHQIKTGSANAAAKLNKSMIGGSKTDRTMIGQSKTMVGQAKPASL